MARLSPDQRNYYYLLEAERTGIHKPILAALDRVHHSPPLGNVGETGLGISPTGTVAPERVDTFAEQVQYAANTIRALTDNLVEQGWQTGDIWDAEKGQYADRFLERVADGVRLQDDTIATLAPCDRAQLIQAYLSDAETDFPSQQAPQNLSYLDRALLSFIERIPQYYVGLAHQREAILEVVRIWRKLDTVEQTTASLARDANIYPINLSESQLDLLLEQFVQRLSPYYSGYPHQREALLRATQLWRRLESRSDAIVSLAKDTSPDLGSKIYDPALIAFVERVPQYYSNLPSQRNALTEVVRLWRNLDSRAAALSSLGIDANLLNTTVNSTALQQVAAQLDRELLAFLRRIPKAYKETDHQREALIRLVQLWRGFETRNRAIDSLAEDLKRLDREKPQTAPKPIVLIPRRPERWTPNNIQLSLSIIPDGNFSWLEATQGGTRMPPNQEVVDAVVRIARLAQRARDRLGYPLIVTSWYRPPHINRAVGGATYSRHLVGDAIDFVCESLSGNQLYWSLDPWWSGGLGRYSVYPELCHIDARSFRARWLH
ncbi:D-Ala-D-Ala carboxypeptidase family metallohydrolase [Oscillatoria sp. FACHB-1406]|uniref:D-Ala-D-Ala carboxypeptidase family metallohydrolase n=1 Tax=Oscillatoria sp. FACHB-1406 TaxID=2692846 RepID=UPI001686E179|nr:D-Ala-D-Ala carboxypeptidase family metallohydrolase [Oscillatoria sp. FACHB-1406]MBD2579814.1 peptidase M15A [Oscillatoria sp. FACHB-1406]